MLAWFKRKKKLQERQGSIRRAANLAIGFGFRTDNAVR